MQNKEYEELDQQIELQGLFDGVENFSGFTTGVHETGVSLGKQLELVAKVLSIRDNFPDNKNGRYFLSTMMGGIHIIVTMNIKWAI